MNTKPILICERLSVEPHEICLHKMENWDSTSQRYFSLLKLLDALTVLLENDTDLRLVIYWISFKSPSTVIHCFFLKGALHHNFATLTKQSYSAVSKDLLRRYSYTRRYIREYIKIYLFEYIRHIPGYNSGWAFQVVLR